MGTLHKYKPREGVWTSRYARPVNFAQLLFPDFSLILCGYLVCRFTALNRSVWEPLESLVYFFLFPVLLFHSIVKSPLDLQAASSLMGAGLALGVCGIALAYSLTHWPWLGRRLDVRLHAASAQVGFRFNSFIALALADKIAGPQGLLMIAVLIGTCVPLFNIGAVWPMARHAKRGFARELLRNPLILATVSGLVANLLGFSVPVWLEPTVNRIGQASLALGLMAAGAGMQLGSLSKAKTLGVAVLGVKHLGMPLLAFGLARLFRLDTTQATILLMFSAVPTASSCYVLAARMGYDGPYVAGLVTLSTLAGMLSLPFALGVLSG
jgi:malonate transporter and related proteins